MSSSILRIKSEEINSPEKRSKYTITIVDCNENGVLHTCLFADAGFKVICVDRDQTVVNNLAKGKTAFLRREIELKLKNHIKIGRLSVTSDIKTAASQSDIIAITMSTKSDQKRKADYSEMESICKQIGSSLRHGSLVVLMSVTGFGITEGRIKEILENTSGLKVGADLGLAYCPIRISSSQTIDALIAAGRIIAATDETSLNAASAILETITKHSQKVGDIKVAEAAALFESAQQGVNVALANELAWLCEKIGADYLKVHKLVAADGYSALPLPTLTQEKTSFLLEESENLNSKLRVFSVAMEVNDEAVKHVVNLVKDALLKCEKTMRRARVTLLGISRVPNSKALPKDGAKELAKALENKGVKLSLYDPYFSDDELARMQYPVKKNLNEAAEGTDCLVIFTGHDQFKRLNLKKLSITMKKPAAIVDLEAILEPESVEKEGLIYRGLGRGVWTK